MTGKGRSEASDLPRPALIFHTVVAAKARRRQFSSGDRRRIPAAADDCKVSGKIGAPLCRELACWPVSSCLWNAMKSVSGGHPWSCSHPVEEPYCVKYMAYANRL